MLIFGGYFKVSEFLYPQVNIWVNTLRNLLLTQGQFYFRYEGPVRTIAEGREAVGFHQSSCKKPRV